MKQTRPAESQAINPVREKGRFSSCIDFLKSFSVVQHLPCAISQLSAKKKEFKAISWVQYYTNTIPIMQLILIIRVRT